MLIVPIVVACASLAYGQSNDLFSHYQKINYETEQGLPQDNVAGIAQTLDGFLWFSTRDGLAQFDGERFTIFRSENTPGLDHNELGALMTDHLGRLWISTLDDLSCYQNGKFRRYGIEDGLPREPVHVMLEDHLGNLWFGTYAGLAVFDGKRFRSFTTKDGLPQNSILGLADDPEGGIWIGTGDGLAHFKDGHFQVFTKRNGLPSDVIDDVLLDRFGRLWVATGRGFAQYLGSGRFKPVQELHGTPWRLYQDHLGNVWASGDVSIAKLASGETSFKEQPVAPDEYAQAMFEDRDGSLWLGTTHKGVICYRRQPFVTFTTNEGLASDVALNVFEDSGSNLWIGTAAGLSEWSHGKMHTVLTQSSLRIGEVHAIAEDGERRLWVGTENGLFRSERNRWTRVHGTPWLRVPPDITSLHVDRKGRLWIGSDEGLLIWDHGKFSPLTKREGLPGNWITSINEDRDNAMWIATTAGLARFGNDGQIQLYTKESGQLLTNFTPSLYQAADGAVWICSLRGLHRWKNGEIRALTVNDGMPMNSVLHLVEDNDGRFWMAGYRGLYSIDPSDLTAVAEGAHVQVPYRFWGSQEGFNLGIAGTAYGQLMLKSRDGTIWIATNHGVVAAQPSELRSASASPPNPVVDAINADGQPIKGTDLQASVRRIVIAFTAPTSINPGQLDFRYRLDGYDREWHDAGALRSAAFTNLPHRSYRFRVSVRRAGGPWNPNEATVEFTIAPFWYETTLFRVFCGVSLMLAFWLAHALRLRQTKRRLSLVLAERSRVANDLHDTLLQSLSGAAMQVRAGLSHLKHGSAGAAEARFSAALEQMGRSQSDARHAIWELTSPELNGNRLTEALHAQAKQLCGEKMKLDYRVAGGVTKLSQNVEEQLYRICLEAVTNSVRHSAAPKVAVHLNFETDCVRLCIQDEGCGFDVTSDVCSNGTHFGLKSMKQRAERSGGELRIISAVGKGTRVELEIPIGARNPG